MNTPTSDEYSYDRVFSKYCDRCRTTHAIGGYQSGIYYYYGYISKHNIICHDCLGWMRIPSICNICNTNFDSRNQLFKHLKNIHKLKCEPRCRTCYQYFEEECQLLMHRKIVHNKRY